MSRFHPRHRTSSARSLRGRVYALVAVTATGLALACSPVLGTVGASASPGHVANATTAKKKCKRGQVLRHNRCVRRGRGGY
jgi:hypothetical protein